MKHILIAIFIVFNFTASFSQETNSITVIGETINNLKKDKSYSAHIQFKELKSDGYSTIEDKSLEKVINEYKARLEQNNLSFNNFTENKVLYFYSSYAETNKTSYYTFKTNSEQELSRLLSVKILGVTLQNVEINSDKLSSDEASELSVKAIENAREKATKIAKKLNKKVGEITEIDDPNLNAVSVNYYNNDNNTYSVRVKFNLL